MKIVWTEPAQASLVAIHDYICLDNPHAADRVVEIILSATARLETFPESGPLFIGTIFRKLRVDGTPYAIYYRIVSDRIIIDHVIHGNRDWHE